MFNGLLLFLGERQQGYRKRSPDRHPTDSDHGCERAGAHGQHRALQEPAPHAGRGQRAAVAAVLRQAGARRLQPAAQPGPHVCAAAPAGRQ